MLCYFFCNDSANTEIYKYWQTLSLHDALPIFAGGMATGYRGNTRSTLTPAGNSVGDLGQQAGPPARSPRRCSSRTDLRMIVGQGMTPDERSEEHTSELQSLMRISYAVFCLKKKTSTTTNTINTMKQYEPTNKDSSTDQH